VAGFPGAVDTTPDAAQALGLSDSAAGRALERLAAAGVARELTGLGRFRVWGAPF
jgi:predicted ArsR family transcriptional regulator